MVFGPNTANRIEVSDEPSMQRSDVAADQIPSAEASTKLVVFLTVIGSYWSIASVPLDRKIVESISNGVSLSACLAIVFPLVGLLILAFAFKLFVQGLSFGDSNPQLATKLAHHRESLSSPCS